jgi:ribosomal protein S18 acetylase RimI-like enzyme
MEEIALIEELAANAVPAAVSQEIDGWRLRFSSGVTRRANSVYAARHGGLPGLDEKIAAAEAFYRRRGLVCRFQLCPASRPTELDATLGARGYSTTTPTFVQTGPLSSMLKLAVGMGQVSEQFDESWLAAYIEGEGETDQRKIGARRAMLQRVGPPAGFAATAVEGRLAAVAFGVVERGWLGIFSVATSPPFRGRGLAAATLGELATWAEGRGATRAYLQVLSTNAPALRLYEKLGFATSYQYWYRERDVG